MSNPWDKIEKKSKEERVETPKVEVIPEPIAPIAEKPKPVQPEQPRPVQNIQIHSEIDSMLLDRLKSQPATLEEIDVEVIEKPQDGRHQLSLPDELKPFTEKYAFCWIFKRKQSIDEACDMLHYKLTNRTYFPDLPDHVFSARGIIEREDNVLAFRPMRIDTEMRKAPGLESIQRIEARKAAHEGNPDFYIPKADSVEEGKVVGV